MSGFVECGSPPSVIATVGLKPSEFMYYLYMPISMAGRCEIELPKRLMYTLDLIAPACNDCEWIDKYIYLTVKSMFVDSACIGNRPGWHIDGFQSNGDINYIWYDANPTEFAVQSFSQIPNDDQASMVEIENQIIHSSIKQYSSSTLLKLDESVVHRATPNAVTCFRTFIKITVSEHKFTNFGNSHNHLLDYNWPTGERQPLKRNLDHG